VAVDPSATLVFVSDCINSAYQLRVVRLGHRVSQSRNSGQVVDGDCRAGLVQLWLGAK